MNTQNNYVYLNPPEPSTAKAYKIDLGMKVDKTLKTIPHPELTPQKIREISEANASAAKKPLKPLPRSFVLHDEFYTLIERTETLAFFEIYQLARYPDGSIPSDAARKHKTAGLPYWDVRRIHRHQEKIVDAFGADTGYLHEPTEFIHGSINLEFSLINDKGMPIPGLGYNRDRPAVYAKYLKISAEDRDRHLKKAIQERQSKEFEVAERVRIEKISSVKNQKVTAVNDLKNLLNGLSIESAMQNKKVISLIKKIQDFKIILETLK